MHRAALLSSFLILSLAGFVACKKNSDATSGSDAGTEVSSAGHTLFVQRCALCHPIGQMSAQGPGLAGIIGRKAGTLHGFTFTSALKDANVTWDAQTLDTFLAMPSKMVPGTTMPMAVPDPSERQALIFYLSTLRAGDSTPAASSSYASSAAFGDYRKDAPGVLHKITVNDLPAPFASPSSNNRPSVAARPSGAHPQVPPGFAVSLFADGLENPREIRIAPNGDAFVAETAEHRVSILRAKDGAAQVEKKSVFAKDLDAPFGIAFYPPGADPKYVYIANNNSVVRFRYRNGDLVASGAPETIIAKIAPTSGGHSTRDIAFSADGTRLLISVGSSNNVGEEMKPDANESANAEKTRGLGAAWDDDENRADILVASPDGKNLHSFANGIRNCVSLAMRGDVPWCATNERDGLGDDLVPDYVTSVKEHAFYGWPWYYLGDHEDPRHPGERADLKGNMTVPDVLLQPHAAALGLAFYDAAMFPAEDRGSLFVALHGSWNRSKRTSPKLIRVLFANGAPTGEYEDFMTGFVIDDQNVWGRLVAVAVAHDGSLLVTDDGGNVVWRIAH